MAHHTYEEAHIVIVDHEPATLRSLGKALKSAGYPAPEEITNPFQASRRLQLADLDLAGC